MLTLIWDFLFKPNVFGAAARYIIAGLRVCVGLFATAAIDGKVTALIPTAWADVVHAVCYLVITGGLLHGVRIGLPQVERGAPEEPAAVSKTLNVPKEVEKALGGPKDGG